jgi:hypothetical protein
LKDNTINPFELGMWAIPFFIVNAIFFGFLILYYKKKLPNVIYTTVRFISNFEISAKTTLIIVLILLAIFIGTAVNDLGKEELWGDYPGTKDSAINWSPEGGVGFLGDFKYSLLHFSLVVFKNIRIIPFITSFFLLMTTYFFTVKITNKRFSGVVSLIILLQSNNFLTYDTTASYSNFWILFYLLSLYLLYKKWYLSPLSYIYSVFSKGLTAVFLPMSIFFIYNLDLKREKKISLIISYVILLLVIFIVSITMPNFDSIIPQVNFDYYNFWNGFSSFPIQLRSDGFVLMSLLPIIVISYIVSKRGIFYANSIMVLIAGILFSAPLLEGLTTLTLEPYRQIPLVVFTSIGVGVILSKKPT